MSLADDSSNSVYPGSSGGVIEVVKRAVIVGLREQLTGISFTDANTTIHVDLEYPFQIEHYPGIWVQFSLTKLQTSGIAQQINKSDGSSVQEWYYEGRVSLMICALSSIHRDRIADEVIMAFAASKMYANASGTTSDRYSPLFKSLRDNPYVSMTINSDKLTSGGQSTVIGVPWQPDKLAYEDNYSFDLIGEFQMIYDPQIDDVILTRVDIVPTINLSLPRSNENQPKNLGRWQ